MKLCLNDAPRAERDLPCSLRGFPPSAAIADAPRVLDVTRHRQITTLKVYDRRAKAFKQHAGETFL
jgi:hypothetical protein